MRLERYNEYKLNLAAEAKRVRFQMPEQGAHITFYIPVPKSWRKHKKISQHLQLHDSTPDVDNCCKAFLDSLLAEDKHIADIRITKRWLNAPKGYISVKVDLPTYPSKDTLV
jgi:Holliday junction resolvase RusA-like endonuclease